MIRIYNYNNSSNSRKKLTALTKQTALVFYEQHGY